MDPAKQPDSTLEAAKKTAAALGMTWSALDPIYRALQQPDDIGVGWIPKSAGRTIFTAHPNYITRLLVGFGFRSPKVTPEMANYIARGLTPEGRPLAMAEWPSSGSTGIVESVIGRLLTDPVAADEVAQLRFDPAEKSLTIRRRDGASGTRLVPAADGFWAEGYDPFRDRVRECLARDTGCVVGSIAVIGGAVLSEIARAVSWRPADAPPVHTDQTDE